MGRLSRDECRLTRAPSDWIFIESEGTDALHGSLKEAVIPTESGKTSSAEDNLREDQPTRISNAGGRSALRKALRPDR